jgi:hypothetical protein
MPLKKKPKPIIANKSKLIFTTFYPKQNTQIYKQKKQEEKEIR